jgi:formylglycine-generating enzyme
MKSFIKYILLISLLPLQTGVSQNTFRQVRLEDKMVLITGGTFTPLYGSKGEVQKVKDFYMDAYPVTNAQYLEFVKNNPKWLRSKVKKIFADANYLKHWKSDLDPGKNVDLNSPVINISWFAAKAYAEWNGERLPTTAEWEYAASAGKNKPNQGNNPENVKRIQEWYSKLSSQKLPPVGSTEKNYWGVYDLFGVIWEWTADFNSALLTGESRDGGTAERNLFCGSGASSSLSVNNYPAFMRYGFRSSLKANYTVSNLGFRCVKDKINKERSL